MRVAISWQIRFGLVSWLEKISIRQVHGIVAKMIKEQQ